MNDILKPSIIDSHIHIWRLNDKFKIWTREKIGALHRDFSIEDFKEQNQPHNVKGVLLVQAVTDTLETIQLLEKYEESSFVKGVIGWLDLADKKIEIKISQLKQWDKFSGVRAHPPRHFDTKWLLSDQVIFGMKALAERKIPIDYLMNTTQLNEFLSVFDKVPDVTAVLNHGGRPFVMTGDTSNWERDIRTLARETNCYCKISGLVERAGVEWDKETLKPWIAILIDAFGPERLLYASNWPIMTLMATPRIWIETLNEIFQDFGLDWSSREQIFSQTSQKIYQYS